MSISGPPAIPANPPLGFGQLADFDKILPACAAMFEEEVGYSPYLGGREYYSRRVKGLIRQGHSLVHLNPDGEVVFKAELGAVTRDVTQVQGVWMNPAYRGRGQSAGYMAAVVDLARRSPPSPASTSTTSTPAPAPPTSGWVSARWEPSRPSSSSPACQAPPVASAAPGQQKITGC